MNVLGDILNADDNVEDQEDYGFTESYFKIKPTVIYEITRNKLMNIQLGTVRSQINIENIDKQSEERNGINMIDEKVSEKINNMDENDEYILPDDMEVLKVGTLDSKRYIYNIET